VVPGPNVYDSCNSESLLASTEALATAKHAVRNKWRNMQRERERERERENSRSYHDCIAYQVVIGGGPTGVEIAGQVAFSFPSCHLTLITSAPKFLERLASSAGQVVLDTLGKLKQVELIVSERVTSYADNVVKLSSGRTIV